MYDGQFDWVLLQCVLVITATVKAEQTLRLTHCVLRWSCGGVLLDLVDDAYIENIRVNLLCPFLFGYPIVLYHWGYLTCNCVEPICTHLLI